MTITTFQQEEIPNPTDLIIKSLFIIVFKEESMYTYYRLNTHPDYDRLVSLYTMLRKSKHLYISIINPVEYTLICKQLVKPINRMGIDEDFDKVDTDLFLTYLNSLYIMSSTISLN